MSKPNNNKYRNLKGLGIGISGALIGYLTKIESLLSLTGMIKTSIIMTVLEIISPIIFGLLCLGIYWLYLTIYDWIHFQLDRIKTIENNIEKASTNESKIKIIENNLLIKDSINQQIAEYIAKESGINIKELYNRYDDKHVEFIKSRSENLTGEQARSVLKKYRQTITNFHELN